METSHCPETSRDANGYNRYCRIKALLNVAGLGFPYAIQCQNSTSEVGFLFFMPSLVVRFFLFLLLEVIIKMEDGESNLFRLKWLKYRYSIYITCKGGNPYDFGNAKFISRNYRK